MREATPKATVASRDLPHLINAKGKEMVQLLSKAPVVHLYVFFTSVPASYLHLGMLSGAVLPR